MIVYCDTSFIFSQLNDDDALHASANAILRRFSDEEFVVCDIHFLELPAAARVATHRQIDRVPERAARRVINRFDRAVNSRIFLKRPVDMVETVAMARSLGETHGWRERHTAFDLWHLAAAWSFSAAAFLTFDKRQARIAKSLGMAG